MVIAEKATGTIGRQVNSLYDPIITMMTSVFLQESDQGLRSDDALWQLLHCPGAHEKLHQASGGFQETSYGALPPASIHQRQAHPS